MAKFNMFPSIRIKQHKSLKRTERNNKLLLTYLQLAKLAVHGTDQECREYLKRLKQ